MVHCIPNKWKELIKEENEEVLSCKYELLTEFEKVSKIIYDYLIIGEKALEVKMPAIQKIIGTKIATTDMKSVLSSLSKNYLWNKVTKFAI